MRVSGKVPSDRQRLIRFVMGATSTSRQGFNNFVGIGSRLQEASVEVRINLRISSALAGEKEETIGGLTGGGQLL